MQKEKQSLTPAKIFAHFDRKYDLRFVPDRLCLQLLYRATMGKKLRLDPPVTFTEKLQWMKLYDRRDEYTVMVDKIAAKEWAAERIGKAHIIPTLGTWAHFDEIDFDALPEQFVLKCNHDSHSAVICRDKAQLNRAAAREKLEKALQKNYFYEGRQWPYKNVKPTLLAEQYLTGDETGDLRDYKFFCFGGEPKLMYIAQGRSTGAVYGDFFDMDYNHVDLKIDHDTAPVPPAKPETFEKMREAAKVLSAGIPQVRADFYELGGEFYFGEMTFFHCGGFHPFTPEKWDEILGEWIKLPIINK